MNNKEVINKLDNFFLKQDHMIVSRLCASLIIDLNRFLNIDQLSDEERKYLIDRTEMSMREIKVFIESDTSLEELFLINKPFRKE